MDSEHLEKNQAEPGYPTRRPSPKCIRPPRKECGIPEGRQGSLVRRCSLWYVISNPIVKLVTAEVADDG